MTTQFKYEFEDMSPQTLRLDYDGADDARLEAEVSAPCAVLYVNKDAALILARALIQLAKCDYKAGFHLHLRRHFDADDVEALRLVLVGDH